MLQKRGEAQQSIYGVPYMCMYLIISGSLTSTEHNIDVEIGRVTILTTVDALLHSAQQGPL